MIAMAAVAAAALTAWVAAGTASATEITCGSSSSVPHGKCEAGQEIHASSINQVIYDTAYGNVYCETTIRGVVTNAGSSTTTPKVDLTALDWSNCGGDTFTTLAAGRLEFHTDPLDGSDAGSGILTSSGTRVTHVHLGVHCIYETSNTSIGTVTGSTSTGHHAVLDISATIPRTGGGAGIFCGTTVSWTGKITFPQPQALVIH